MKDAILRLKLDEPGPGPGEVFSDRLAREQGWDITYAWRVIDEYQRFLCLAVTVDHLVCPSDQVDQVWHQHLIYTEAYWDRLCRDILRRPLHHTPSRGGAEEDAIYREAYVRTLQSYREMFGDEPPPAIWPPVERRFPSPALVAERKAAWAVGIAIALAAAIIVHL